MKFFIHLAFIFLILNSALPAKSASIIPICRNLNKTIDNCAPEDILFATYSSNDNIMIYKIDRGAIGEISQEDARSFADEVLALWENNSGIDFQAEGDGYIEEDVNESNFNTYLDSERPLGYSPVIWDETGSLINDLFGKGSKDNILGFAGAVFYSTRNGLAQGIIESNSVFNGYLFNGANTDEDRDSVINTFKTTILHEFGHMFGLDHTQGGNNEGYNKYANGELDIDELTDVPVMFPIAANPLVELQQDDIAAVRLGYPKGDEGSLYGTITGKLKQRGAGIRGASVVAFLVDDTNPRKKAIACPSDVDGAGEGNFRLPNLVPGNYIIKAEPLNSIFKGGSSVGLHSPISPNLLQDNFYMGEGVKSLMTADLNTGIDQALKINVQAGLSTDINFDLDLASFKIKNKVLENPIGLKNSKKRIITLNIRNFYPGETRTLKFTTDHPDLIEILPASEISSIKKNFSVRIRLASYQDFLSQFPEIENGNLFIPLTIEDLNTGYILDTESFWLF
jgi:hypothetical protein